MMAMEQIEIQNRTDNIPNIFDEYSLASVLGTTVQQLWFYIKFNNTQYSTFYIDKDTKEIVDEYDPSRRLRTISAPKPGLKFVQGSLSYNIFRHIHYHDANYAYTKGRSILDAALKQLPNDVLIKIDLVDFFGSHTAKYVSRRLAVITGYPEKVCWMISRLCCKDGRLPQGSPASPILSLILNTWMDDQLEALCEEGVSYTRYADDIAFSGPDRPNSEYWALIKKVSSIVYPFKVNWDKVDVMRSSAYRYLCGVTIPSSEDRAVEGFNTSFSNGSLKIYRREPLTDEEVRALVGDSAFEPIYYYVQDIRHMLGLNLSDEEVKIPRFKYYKLRREAMLAGLGYVNEARFKGRLSYLRSIEPARAIKIDEIYNKYKEIGTNGTTSI